MTVLDRLLQRRSIETDGVSINWQALADILGSGSAAITGKVVNPSTAMQLTAVYACVTLISETMGSLPLLLYRRTGDGKTRAMDHALYGVLHDAPNDEQTSMDFRSLLMAHVLLYGKCYAEVVRNGAGQVKELWPIPPWLVTEGRNSRNELVYTVRLPDKNLRNLGTSRVLKIQAPLGLSPIAQAREALGLTMASEEYGARWFANDSTPGGIVEHPGHLGSDAQDRIKKQIEQQTQGLSKKHRLMILEEGMKWTQIGMSPEDSQMLETRKFQVGEIARIFHVPPHMIGDVEKSTSWGTGIEQQNIGFITYTLRSWMVRWEQGINNTLLTEDERKNYFAEHLVDGLLRGDAQTRYSNYSIGRQNGWLSGNDIRILENMDPVDGLDAYLVNGNMVPVDQVGKKEPLPTPPEPNPGAGNNDGEEGANPPEDTGEDQNDGN